MDKNKTVKHKIIGICSAIFILELIVLIMYFCIFNGGISTDTQDWNIFLEILNGLTMAILTAVNIYIFYKLTITIENKNHERNIKVKIDNVQSVITQLRVKQYEDIRSLICDIKVELMQKYYNPHNIHKLKKKLMEMDESFLYKSYNLNDSSYMFPIIKTIIDTTQNIEKGIKKNIEVNCEPLIEQLTDFLHIVEFYIFGQMLTSSETANYISENKDNIDCSLKCIDDFAKELIKRLKEK